MYNLFGGRRILLSDVLVCVAPNFWCRRMSIDWMWMNGRTLLRVVCFHSTHTIPGRTQRPWKILFSVVRSSAVREAEVGTFDADKLPYGLIYWCGLVTFRLPHPDYNDIVHGHLVGSSVILGLCASFSLAARLVFVDAHTSAMSSRLKSHYHSCRRTAAPYRSVLHIRIIGFSNWIK